MGLAVIADFIYVRPEPAVAGYELPEPPPVVTGPQAPPQPLPNLLAAATVSQGKQNATPCTTCHNFEKGAAAKIGPPLYGVVGRAVASVAGFQYSDALKSKGGDWTFDTLNAFITSPKAYAPGTKMTFAGENDPKRRAAILVYLRSLSDDPVPLPAKVAEPVAPTVPGAKAPPTLPELLAAADPKRGQSDTRVCSNCHNFDKGGTAKIGPPLYGVVGRPVASVAGFDYSEAMKGKGGNWTYEDLFAYLADPRSVVKGTKMSFSARLRQPGAPIFSPICKLCPTARFPSPPCRRRRRSQRQPRLTRAPSQPRRRPPRPRQLRPAKPLRRPTSRSKREGRPALASRLVTGPQANDPSSFETPLRGSSG